MALEIVREHRAAPATARLISWSVLPSSAPSTEFGSIELVGVVERAARARERPIELGDAPSSGRRRSP